MQDAVGSEEKNGGLSRLPRNVVAEFVKNDLIISQRGKGGNDITNKINYIVGLM